LEGFLSLGLRTFVEEVATIVERASKELIIEKNLRKIEEAWGKMELTYEQKPELDVYLLGSTDDIVEVLEDHNSQLQTMQSNRFVEYFADDVMAASTGNGPI
jgi:dynein heavy chain